MSDDKQVTGRPTKYTEDIADELCARIMEGKSVRTICADEDMPCAKTFYNWLRKHEVFLQQYVHAKEEQADALVEDMLHIADQDAEDGVQVQHARLRVDTRKWIASKLKSKKYGDKITHAGDKDAPLTITTVNYAPDNNTE